MCIGDFTASLNPQYRQRCTTACVVLLLVGLSLHLAAVVVPAWALEKTTIHHPFEGIGLWRRCIWNQTSFDIKCISLAFKNGNPAWLLTIQVLEGLSIGTLLGAVLSAFVSRRRSYRHLQPPAYFLLGLSILGAVLMLIGVVIYGVAVKTPSGDYVGNFHLGWGFFLDVVALMVISACAPLALYLLTIVRKYPYAEMYPGYDT